MDDGDDGDDDDDDDDECSSLVAPFFVLPLSFPLLSLSPLLSTCLLFILPLAFLFPPSATASAASRRIC